MGLPVKVVAVLLMFFSILTIYTFIERQIIYAKSKKKSQQIAPKIAELLKAGKNQEALNLASKKEYRASHVARVSAAGIREFMEGEEAGLSLEQQIETAVRGCDRASIMFTQELKRGLNTIATIATSSPFIGLFGTIIGIINAFRGMALTGSGGIGAVAAGIAEALVATGFGILVAIVALWVYNFLNNKVEILGAEMSNTTSEVVDFFSRKRA
ncbi:MAG: MotA/TolQ/ExbB proton channel family protein [Candidatus Aminicenantes bacterium]